MLFVGEDEMLGNFNKFKCDFARARGIIRKIVKH